MHSGNVNWEALVKRMDETLTPEQRSNIEAVLEAVDNHLGKDRDFNKVVVARMFHHSPFLAKIRLHVAQLGADHNLEYCDCLFCELRSWLYHLEF